MPCSNPIATYPKKFTRILSPPIAPAVALAWVKASPFNIERSLESLQSFYEEQCLHQQPGSPVSPVVK